MAAGQSFRELLDVLARHEVDFVVVGATAAVLGGAPITTFDLDVLFDNREDNRRRLLAALDELDAVYLDPLRRAIRPTDERLRNHRLSLFETRLGRLDVMAEIAPGWVFADAEPRSPRMDLGTREIRVLDLDAVIESKEAADRPKDRAALPLLRELSRMRAERRAREAPPGGDPKGDRGRS